MSDAQEEVKVESNDSGEFKDAPSSPVVEPKSELEPDHPQSAVGLDDDSGTKGDELDAEQGETTESGSPKLEAAAPIVERSRRAPSPAVLPAPLHIEPSSHPAEALHAPESPTTSLISSLRSQLNLVSEQAHQLNQKLVSSISRSADLEDELHELQSKHSDLGEKAKGLEEEKNRWEESMNTGLLVERSQIKDEMQRLAAGLVEEERRRGSAEEKRAQVENEVDDLTAKLFDQANTMVVTERMSRVQAEARLKSTEDNLAAAEAAVRDMQLHLQSLPPSAIVATAPSTASPLPANVPRKYLASHVPYSEYVSFLQHVRALRPIRETSKIPPPLVANLLAQPFLARAIVEDNDPTLRLDVAPDLNWLSRRSVGQAVISGDLIVEPVSTSTVLAGTSTPMLDIGCSLCGKPIFAQPGPASPASHFGPPPMHPHRNSGSQSRFSLKPFFNASSSATVTGSPSAAPLSPSQSPLASPALNGPSSTPSSVYVFRIARPQQATGQSTEKSDAKAYPLCRSGWCLERMRATCELWHFIRTSIIHVVWHSDDGTAARSSISSGSQASHLTAAQASGLEPREIPTPESKPPSDIPAPPPLPGRKKSSWALGFKLSEKSSGGWTRGWKSGGSEPISPSAEKRGSFGSLGAEKEGDASSDTEAGLGAPLEISEKGIPAIQEPSVSDHQDEKLDGERSASPAEIDDIRDASEKGEEKLEAPTLQRGTSTTSIALSTSSQTDEAASFSTPKGTHHELSDEEGATEGGEVGQASDIDRERTPIAPHDTHATTVELDSPTQPESPRTSGDGRPPPIPRRAAARNRISQLGESTESEDKVERSKADSGADINTLKESDDHFLAEKTGELAAEGEGELTVVDITEEKHVAPPLPPRHPRTPNLADAQHGSNQREKRFVTGDGWEEKTWRQVIKLKEEMWKARIGVVDE